MAGKDQKTYSDVDSFFSDANQALGTIRLSGIVKEHQAEPETFLWSPISCESWIAIEKAAVLRISELGRMKCSGFEDQHEHHFVEITLNPESCKNAGAINIIHSLIQRSMRSMAAASSLNIDGKVRPQYEGPCGAAWVCQDNTYIHCNSNARPYEDYSGRCECIPC